MKERVFCPHHVARDALKHCVSCANIWVESQENQLDISATIENRNGNLVGIQHKQDLVTKFQPLEDSSAEVPERHPHLDNFRREEFLELGLGKGRRGSEA